MASNKPVDLLNYRKYPRATFQDYNMGCYFVTVCTRNKYHYFGEIIDGNMILSPLGEILDANIKSISTHFSFVEIPLFVVMPNHFHAIVCIENVEPQSFKDIKNIGRLNQLARLSVATGRDPTMMAHHNSRLAVIVGSIKSHVTRYARRNNIDFGWQPRFHDHIVRGKSDGNMITDYIKYNVARWDCDCYNV